MLIDYCTVVHQQDGSRGKSKLKLLVPSVGNFFTSLPLEDAFVFQDNCRFISSRRFVPPSFNDLRLILNTAQVMSMVRGGGAQLMTFDGDVTLYDDGASLTADNPVIPHLLRLLQHDIKVGIVTAAGYTEPAKYYGRLSGLLEAIKGSPDLSDSQKKGLIVMGGESNFLFTFNADAPHLMTYVRRREWILDEMRSWTEADITDLLNVAEKALRECVTRLKLPAEILRKERAVGIYPRGSGKFTREQLEETVLVVQQLVELSPVAKRLPFCAFNGGNDVFVDIGDKSWGVIACQQYFGGIPGSKTLHVGDQFLSAGANDFKARLACTTAWIASPGETVQLLDEMMSLEAQQATKER